MAKQLDVYGIGNAIMDIQAQVSEPDFLSLGLEKGGMNLVDVEAQTKLLSSLSGKELHHSSGGSAANTIIALTQLGARTGYGCIVGQDHYGELYLSEMKELGVQLHTPPLPSDSTGTSVILVTPDAERTMNTCLGASAQFSKEHVSEELVEQASWLYVEGYLFATDLGREAIGQAVKIAKAKGTRIAVTFSDGFIVDCFREHLERIVSQADLLFANFPESQAYTKQTDEESTFKALKSAAPNVVMTLHERGARGCFDGEDFQVPSWEVEAVDTTGAGDMFAGGFLYGVSQGVSGGEAAKLACYLASQVVSQIGPRLHLDIQKLPEMPSLIPS